MRLAIVGSTRLAGHPEAKRIIKAIIEKYKPDVVVSGGAKGIDSMAAAQARALGIEVLEFKPQKQQWNGPGGFKERNEAIANNCDRLIRIVAVDTTTYGSGWTRDRAEDHGIPTEQFFI